MIEGWLVIGRDGHKALFKDKTEALNYAAKVHGIIMPLGVIE